MDSVLLPYGGKGWVVYLNDKCTQVSSCFAMHKHFRQRYNNPNRKKCRILQHKVMFILWQCKFLEQTVSAWLGPT